jgi:putative ABC transport system ATP-binding protein
MEIETLNTTKTAVHVENVVKHFGEGEATIFALRGINFNAYCGEIMMIVGPSGCGKTTLLSVIAGTLDADEGTIQVFDNPIHSLSTDDVTRFRGKNVGFIFQQFNLIPTLTILENAAIPLLIQRTPKGEAYSRAAEVLKRVGLGERIHARPGELSGGQQQRVAIARALVHEPRLIICDEPTANLDGENGQKIMELLSDVVKSPDRCVIVVTHDTRIFQFADRMAQMEDGRVKNVHQNKPAA